MVLSNKLIDNSAYLTSSGSNFNTYKDFDVKDLKVLSEFFVHEKASSVKVFSAMDKNYDLSRYLMICIAKSSRHSRYLAGGCEDEARKLGLFLSGREGYEHGMWIAMDFCQLIVHIFERNEYEAYHRHNLWPSKAYSKELNMSSS